MEAPSSKGGYLIQHLVFTLCAPGGCDGEGVLAGHSPDWSQFWRDPCGDLLQTRQPHGEAVCRGKGIDIGWRSFESVSGYEENI